MNKTKEVIETINITVKELDDLIKKQANYSYLVGCEFGFGMAKNFIEMYEEDDIEKINLIKLKEILEFQIEGVKAIQKQYEKSIIYRK